MTTPSDDAPDEQMNSAAATSVAAPLSVVAPPNLRQTQKEATRNRVIEAARELFDTQGYQGTTIREIAAHAGVSVGSVFTTFASKYEVLSQVMVERLDGLYAEVDRVMPHVRGSTVDRLRTLFGIFLSFEMRHKRLFLAYIAAAFDWTLTGGETVIGRNRRLLDIMRDCLVKGMAQGDVRSDLDVEDTIQLMMAAYIWSYRLAAWHDADAPALTEVMDRQIALIAAGFTPKG